MPTLSNNVLLNHSPRFPKDGCTSLTFHPRHSLGLPPVYSGIKIGLFGGSFDPPHKGHLHVSQWAFRQLSVDQVWWLVTTQNPMKNRVSASIEQRVQAAKEFVNNPRIIITCLENHIGFQYTIFTLCYLKQKFAGLKFVWMMGSDNLQGFEHWYQRKEIIKQMPIAVFPRPSFAISSVTNKARRHLGSNRIKDEFAAHLIYMDPPAWTILSVPHCHSSSSAIRNREVE